jgi:pre-mRNA-splicing factor SYF2
MAVAARMARLKALSEKREEANELNLTQVKEECIKQQMHPHDLARIEKKKERAAGIASRIEAKEKGIDSERKEALKYTADEIAEWEKKQAKRDKIKDTGFSDYAQMTKRKDSVLIYRKYKKLFSKLDAGDTRQVGSSTAAQTDQGLVLGSKPSEEGTERMSRDLEKQIETRRTFSKRKKFDDDADVTYINERNLKFNLKIARFYDRYTKEFKDNLERGTAL